MEIKSIESFVLTNTLDESFFFSQWEYATRQICLVKVTASDGTVGWGEGYGPATVVKSGVDFLGQFIKGMNPLETDAVWSVMYRRTLDYARRGILVSAISAIDVALWDVKGKILGQPVHRLLGGKKRETIHPYATGMYYSRCPNLAQKLADEARTYAQAGYTAMKMKVGLTPEADVRNVQAVREAIGSDIRLMIDANHAYNLTEATALCQQLEPLDIAWFEEPVSPEHYGQYAELRTRTSIPIAGGECEYMRYGFQQLFAGKCVDIAQPDICSTGGLTEARKIADLAMIYGVDVVPHTWGTNIAISAAINLAATLDKVPGRMYMPEQMIELDRTENALRDEVTKLNYIVDKGVITITDEPGLGVEVDEELIKKYVL
ncbi:MAG: mandelate racemase/muconate lactonizing enzyme family protein [Massilibacteroides sp.]|nr:mandelate racemase/muconate lactonizing enzyme family protein [Massilibacteroides sp.]